jgi:hypothetical protein
MGLRMIAVKTMLLTGLVALLFAGSAAAAPIEVVANGNDSGAGSLREAIAKVDAGGTIVIPASVGEIALSSELVVNKSLTIEGPGSSQTAIDGQRNSRVLKISGAPTVTISGVQILEGGIAVEGGLPIPQQGAGILLESGSLTLTEDLLVSNVVDTTVGGHSGIAEGGAIATAAGTALTLHDTIVSDNEALGGTGGNGWGGGIAAYGSLKIVGGSLKGNTAQGASVAGGALFLREGPGATLSEVSVTGNAAEPAPGGGAGAEGGGIDIDGGVASSLNAVTIAGNIAKGDDPTSLSAVVEGGGIHIAAPTTIVNSTITGNITSANVQEGGLPLGGGIAAIAPTTIVNSTLSGNSSRGSGIGLDSAGGDLWAGATVQVANSIFAEGTVAAGAQNCAIEPFGAIVSGGHNIDSLDQCNLHAGGDQIDTSPALRPLAENGGPVETMALQPGSPAIDAGGAAGCPATDARGVLRPAGAACDVGAFEVATPSAITETASGVGTGGATLVGVATNPDLAGGSVSFQFGTTTAYGSQTAAQGIGATTRGASFAATVAGLSPGTTYHYREVVTNAAGTAVGADRTFATQSPTTPISGVGPPVATLTVKHLGGRRFRVHCAGAPCHGTLVATARSGKRTVFVAKAKLRLDAGETEKVTLKLTGAGKRLVALPGKLPVVVKVALGGPKASAPKSVRFKLR